MDLGLEEARLELRGDRRIAESLAAIIMLTDGIQSDGPSGDPVQAARKVHISGIELYIIGLGNDVNQAILMAMSNDPEKIFFTPDSLTLQEIYTRIATSIGCP